MNKIDVAVVGCGYVANDHLKAWKRINQTRVVAVSDLNEALAKKTAESWKIPYHYTSLSDLMGHNKIGIVDICTPPQTHAALAVQAMKSGSNVLIEKPMTLTVKDAEEIVECQKTTGVKAGVIHNWLFEPPVLRADSVVREGYLGEVFGAEIEALCPRDEFMTANEHHWSHHIPGGRFSEMLAHPIYLLRHFLGEIEVSDVQVSKIGTYSWMQSDELSASFRAGEKLGRAYASFNAPRDAIFISLFGKQAILKLDIINATISLLSRRKTSRFSKGSDTLKQSSQLMGALLRNAGKVVSGRWWSGHDMCIRLFTESLINDREPPATVEEGLAAIRTLEEMCKRIENVRK